MRYIADFIIPGILRISPSTIFVYLYNANRFRFYRDWASPKYPIINYLELTAHETHQRIFLDPFKFIPKRERTLTNIPTQHNILEAQEFRQRG